MSYSPPQKHNPFSLNKKSVYPWLRGKQRSPEDLKQKLSSDLMNSQLVPNFMKEENVDRSM